MPALHTLYQYANPTGTCVQVGCAGVEVPRLGSSDWPGHQHSEGRYPCC